MASKNRQDSESTPPDPDDGNLNEGSPVDETIRIEQQDSTRDLTESDRDEKASMDTTIDGLSPLVQGQSGESKTIPDPHETVSGDPHGTLMSKQDSGDPDATVNLESTVGVDQSTPTADANENAVGDARESTDVESSGITVASSESDQTAEVDAGTPTPPRIVVYPGNRTKTNLGATTTDPLRKTALNTKDVPGGQTAALQTSIMASENIGQTVNPRDLSPQDATLWNSAVGDSKDDASVLPPAIDRTFSDKQFDRLRQCDVSSVKSDPEKTSDYRLVRKLGQGGMGDVYVARQGSLDRLLALKLIKPLTGKKRAKLIRTGRLESVEEERRQQFLSEAIVTGDLDHPNIVPIHDVALTSGGELFYSMKRVVGTPWSDVIRQKSRDENVEILLKAADAIGHAHTRGVVHRDIKPENTMLGDFGVVMVMDWGLALPTSQYEKPSSIFATSGLGGTPAFMAPEMATGPLEIIGPASDIYLLGATLFMIITGVAPHHAKSVTACLRAVRTNTIRDVPQEQQGELLDIALKAMETEPADRYSDVESFQKAIRDYRSHAESISLASSAEEDLQHGRENRAYADLSRAAFRFEEAIKSWSGNAKAHLGFAETKLAHANAAYENGDFDLGLSLLDDQLAEHEPLIKKLRDGLHERESRATRLSLMRKVAVAMMVFIIVGGSAATYNIYKSKLAADLSTQSARKAEGEAKTAKENLDVKNLELADTNRQLDSKNVELEDSLVKERVATQRAVDAANAEQVARGVAEYEEYVAKIGLAKARLDGNDPHGARELLIELSKKEGGDHELSRDRTDSWEWQRLWRRANQSESSQKMSAAVIDSSLGPSGLQGVVALSDGTVELFNLSKNDRLTTRRRVSDPLLNAARATSVAIAPDESLIAVGTALGKILLLPLAPQGGPKETRKLEGHADRINDLQFSAEGLLVSGSEDRTVRIWDIESGSELTKACWHISPVRQVAVTPDGPSITLAVAVSDNATGRVAIWQLSRNGEKLSIERGRTWTKHRHPVSSVAISDDGQTIASGDIAGNVLIWNPADAPPIKYAEEINAALNKLDSRSSSAEERPRKAPEPPSLVDRSSETDRRLDAASTRAATPRTHDDVVKTIRFSKDGKTLLTSSDDYTLKVWDVSTRRLRTTLKGHAGWVVGADFLRGKDDVIVSASNDATIRSWRPGQYVSAFVVHKDVTPATQRQAHDDEIVSASFSSDGSKVVTAGHDHTARVMEIDPETLLFKKVTRLEAGDELLSEGTSFVAMSMQVDRAHKRLYVGNADATIRIWDMERGTQVGEANGTGLNTSFALSADGRFMLTGSSSPTAKAILWRLDPTGNSAPEIIHRLQLHEHPVTAFAISRDSSVLFTGDRDGLGILWNASTGQKVGSPIEVVQGRINAAGFSVDGRELLIAADDQNLTAIDTDSRGTRRMRHDGSVTQLSISSDQRHAMTISQLSTKTRLESVATLWDLQTGQDFELDRIIDQRDEGDESPQGIRRRITSAQFDDSGMIAVVSLVASDGKSGSVQVWDVDQVSPSQQTGKLTGATVARDPSDVPRKKTPRQMFRIPAILGVAEAVLPIDESSILTMNNNGAFKWDLDTMQLVKSYRAHAELTEARFSADGLFVATGSRSVKIWDAESGEALDKLESPHIGPVRSVRFSPNSYVFATGGDDGVARTWRWNHENRQIVPMKEYVADPAADGAKSIRSVCFSPDGNRLLVVGDDGSARLWDLTQANASIELSDAADAGDFTCAAFSQDGACVAVGSTDHKARLWEIPEPGQQPDDPIEMVGHADTINDIAVLGERSGILRVMTASSDDTARVWDPRLDARDDDGNDSDRREIISLRRHLSDVTAIDIAQRGKLLMTAGRDGAVILWPADPPPNPADRIEADHKEN